MYKLSNLTDKVRQMIGGVPQTLNQVGRAVMDNQGVFQQGRFTPLQAIPQVKQANTAVINNAARPLVNTMAKAYQPLTNYVSIKGIQQERARMQTDPGLGTRKLIAAARATPNAAFQTYGLMKGGLSAPFISGAFGGVLNKASGGSFQEGFQGGVKASPTISAIGSFSNPLISKLAGGASRFIANPVGKQAVSRIATGLGNIPEGLAMSRGLGQSYTPGQAGFDFGAGLVMGPSAPNAKVKGSVGNRPNTIHPEDMGVADRLKDFFRVRVKNAAPQEIRDAQNIIDDLAGKYLTKAEVDKVVEKARTTKNNVKYYEYLNDEIRRKFKNQEASYGYASGLNLGFTNTKDYKNSISDAIQNAKSAEEGAQIVKNQVDNLTANAKSENDIKAVRASLNQFINESIGTSGNWKRDYYVKNAEVFGNPDNLHLQEAANQIDRVDEILSKGFKATQEVSKLTPEQQAAKAKLPKIMLTTSKVKAEGKKIKDEVDPFLRDLANNKQYKDLGIMPDPLKKKKVVSESYSEGEAQQMAGEALVNTDIKNKETRSIISRFIGKKEAARTTATQKSIKFASIPESIANDVIRVRENPSLKVSADARIAAKEIGKEYDNLFTEVKKLDTDTKQTTNYLKNYITHIWEQPVDQVMEMYRTAKQKFKFSNERTLPTYEEGLRMGLKPKFTHPAEILQEYVKRLEETKASVEMFKDLKKERLIVPASVAAGKPQFEAIQAPGFPRSVSMGADGKVYYGSYYAPREIAQQINKIFSPDQGNAILRAGASISSKLQDITLSGGVPQTPINAFTFANLLKEVQAGRIVSPISSLVRSISKDQSAEYFAKNADVIRKMQERNIPLRTEFETSNFIDKGIVKNTFGENIGQAWDKIMNEPTFKRFLPMLQINLFKDIEQEALKQGKSSEMASDIASRAVKNFYGVITSDTQALRSANVNNAASTVLFAPKFRESMINFWVNNVKALKDPLSLENQMNTRFLIGAIATYAAMNALNKSTYGRNMHENPPGTEDKLLIPTGDGNVIGVPYLSSIGTVPRTLYKIGKQAVQGNFPQAIQEGKAFLSSAVRPPLDVLTNENYYGQPIYDEADKPDIKAKKIIGYLAGQYNHPYLRAAIEAGAGKFAGIPEKDQPTYALILKTVEAPLRFYTEKSLKGKEYYGTVDKIVSGLPADKRSIYDTVYKKDDATADTATKLRDSMSEAQLLLANMDVFETRKKIEVELAKREGKAIDPIYNLTPQQQQIVLQIKALPPGDETKSALQTEHIEWLKPYWTARTAYFDELEKQGVFKSDTEASDYFQTPPKIRTLLDEYYKLPYGTGERSAMIVQHPELVNYWDEKREFTNNQRALLNLPPLEDKSFTKWPKKPRKVSMPKIRAAKMPKINIKMKIPTLKKLKKTKLTFKKAKRTIRIKV